MKRILLLGLVWLCVVAAASAAPPAGSAGKEAAWRLNATIIEACSCPMFCQCYFTPRPAAHRHGGTESHFCKFNNAFRVNKGHHGATRLDGVKFWVAGDLGGDFSKGMMDWAVVTFDRAATPDQRAAIQAILGHLYPVQWKSLTTAEGEISWTAGKDEARALIDGGKIAEVHLKRFQGMTDEPVVIRNLKYWGAPHNDGFVLMPNVVEAYRAGAKAYEYRGTNGFMITFDIASTDVAPAAPAGKTSGR
jgi:hypothetical protein